MIPSFYRSNDIRPSAVEVHEKYDFKSFFEDSPILSSIMDKHLSILRKKEEKVEMIV